MGARTGPWRARLGAGALAALAAAGGCASDDRTYRVTSSVWVDGRFAGGEASEGRVGYGGAGTAGIGLGGGSVGARFEVLSGDARGARVRATLTYRPPGQIGADVLCDVPVRAPFDVRTKVCEVGDRGRDIALYVVVSPAR